MLLQVDESNVNNGKMKTKWEGQFFFEKNLRIQFDINRDSEIKQEPVDIKEEPVDPDEFSRPWETYNEPDPEPTERKIVFECRICIQRKNRFIKKFTSIIALTKHIHRHTKKCEDCPQVFKTWKELHDHEKYCPRRFGVCDRKPDRSMRAPKPVKTPYKFQLCKRRYQTKEHLLNHQINRCAARYVTNAWVVKI